MHSHEYATIAVENLINKYSSSEDRFRTKLRGLKSQSATDETHLPMKWCKRPRRLLDAPTPRRFTTSLRSSQFPVTAAPPHDSTPTLFPIQKQHQFLNLSLPPLSQDTDSRDSTSLRSLVTPSPNRSHILSRRFEVRTVMEASDHRKRKMVEVGRNPWIWASDYPMYLSAAHGVLLPVNHLLPLLLPM